MRLVFQALHATPPQPARVGQLPARATYGDSLGSFEHNGGYEVNGEGTVLSVWFNPQIRVVNGLDTATFQRVRTHENEHYRSFVQLAGQLRQGLQAAMNQRRDPDIDLRWEWFLFDLNQRANEYHRQSGQGDVRVVVPPNRPRPTP